MPYCCEEWFKGCRTHVVAIMLGVMLCGRVSPAEHNYWPRSGSVLIGSADRAFAVPDDFNRTDRKPPHDIGAYEVKAHRENPGWRITAGFKQI